jgi:hypothetical protein
MERIGWLSCKVTASRIPNEFAVLVATAEGRVLSMFLGGATINFNAGRPEANDERDASIRVQIVDEDETYKLVVLPQATLEGSRYAKVEGSRVLSEKAMTK